MADIPNNEKLSLELQNGDTSLEDKTDVKYQEETEESEMLGGETEKTMSLREKLKTNEEFRRKFIIWLVLCTSFVVLGFNLAQLGPTLLDLQLISRCSIEEAALFFTALSTGYLLASFIVSITFDRFDKFLQIAIGNFGIAVAAGVIPWCVFYGVMLTMHLVKGFMCGIAELATSSYLIHIMGTEVRTYMQILHFSYTIGGILSPIVAAPFLTPVNDTEIFSESSNNFTNISLFNYTNNSTRPGYTDAKQFISEVYKPYAISTAITLLSVFPFIYMYFKFKKQSSKTTEKKKNENNDLPFKVRIPVLCILLLISFVCFSLEDCIAGFTPTYAVKHFGWTKQKASYVASVFWASFSIGSFSGIFITHLFKISKLLLFYSFMIVVSTLCLVVSSVYLVDAGMWIFAGLSGFFTSLNWPLLFAWTEEEFLHVTARVNAMIVTTASIGVMVSPVLVGVLLDTSPIYYSYFLLSMSVVLFLLFFIGKLLSIKTKKFRKSSEIEITDQE